jgi:hypothetical protein
MYVVAAKVAATASNVVVAAEVFDHVVVHQKWNGLVIEILSACC